MTEAAQETFSKITLSDPNFQELAQKVRDTFRHTQKDFPDCYLLECINSAYKEYLQFYEEDPAACIHLIEIFIPFNDDYDSYQNLDDLTPESFKIVSIFFSKIYDLHSSCAKNSLVRQRLINRQIEETLTKQHSKYPLDKETRDDDICGYMMSIRDRLGVVSLDNIQKMMIFLLDNITFTQITLLSDKTIDKILFLILGDENWQEKTRRLILEELF